MRVQNRFIIIYVNFECITEVLQFGDYLHFVRMTFYSIQNFNLTTSYHIKKNYKEIKKEKI